MSLPSDFFIAGGTLRAQAPSYVMRPADQELFEHTLAGEFCYVLTPRQMGKSSLMIRTARRLAAAGRTVAILDLTGIGSGSADQWYLGLLEQIARDLRLNIDVPNWWQARTSLTIPQRFSEFLRDVVLQEIAGPVVIFIDEIDSTLNLEFRDDFFAAIRAIYNGRATESAYKRLTFALLGVATPTDLIHDRERTPFNIGRRIILQEFSYDEAESLKTGLDACHPSQGDVILSRIFDWANGYPYLTQKLCLAATERPTTHWDAAQVDEVVETTFFSDIGRKDPNFKFVQQRIQESSAADRQQMLNLYRKVYSGKSIPDDDRSQSQNHLELYGLVRVERGKLHVRNDIYRRIFDQKWIKANMPANRDLGLAIGASLAALLVIVAVWILIRQTPSPSASLYIKQFNDNAFPTARIEALAGLFNVQNGLYDRDDEQGLRLFYNLDPYDQLDLFSQAKARARGREMVTAIRRISLTLDEQDSNDQAMMGEMITALGATGQPNTATLIDELSNWKSGRELAEKGQYQDATTAYSETIQLNPDNLAARYDRASALIKLKKYNEALKDLNQIIVIAKTAPPPPTSVPTSIPTPTSVLAVTGTPLASSAVGIPKETVLSTTAVPMITATSVLTPTVGAVSSKSRFINTELIIKTVTDTVQENEDLLNYLQDPQNQTAYQDLSETLGLSSIVQENTPQANTPQPPTIAAPTPEPTSNGAVLSVGSGGNLFKGAARKGTIDPSQGNGGSCIQGMVLAADGSTFSNFYVQVDSRGITKPAQHFYDTGNYKICGLSAGEWGVAVYSVNNTPTSGAEQAGHQVRVQLSGQPGDVFYVDFRAKQGFAPPTEAPTDTSPPSPTNTPTPPPTDTPQPVCVYQEATDEATLTRIIGAEAEAALTKNMWIIEHIFAVDAVITDATNNRTWLSPKARYTELFNTVDFTSVENVSIQRVDITDMAAHFTSGSRGTFQIVGGNRGEFLVPAGLNQWAFRKNEAGCWMITAFSFR